MVRITQQQQKQIKVLVTEIAGANACVKLFGSRVDDNRRGGDVDLLVEIPVDVDNPAMLSARLSARVSRLMQGRKVDVLLTAPNLKQFSIHQHARFTGVEL